MIENLRQEDSAPIAPVTGSVKVEKVKNTRPSIPDKVLRKLWVNSGGRCQYDGCNEFLLEHALVKAHFNKAYVAHIIAVEPDGPRGDEILSPQLATDYNNLMLLCDECHRLIDRDDVAGHPVPVLTLMKRKQEERIRLVTSIMANRESHLLLYGANIGPHSPLLSYQEAASTIMPEMFPARSHAVELSLGNCAFEDDELQYWEFQDNNLKKIFRERVQPILDNGGNQHFSVFALAPMPLLMRLGTLLPDMFAVDVYQRKREPQTWKWVSSTESLELQIQEPQDKTGAPVLNISLSATITDDRIENVLTDKLSIWKLTIATPNIDCIKTPQHLEEFRTAIRTLLDRIKAVHGQTSELNIFPAMPASTAIELGRVWMPKADMTLHIYDNNKTANSFIYTLTI